MNVAKRLMSEEAITKRGGGGGEGGRGGGGEGTGPCSLRMLRFSSYCDHSELKNV